MEIPLLTQGESKVYGALVELGESSVGNIIKISGVSHSKIYDILRRLANKGIVSSINKNGRQYFLAADPKNLKRLIKDEEADLAVKKEKISEIIDKLEMRKEISSPKSILSSYEGFKGMQTVLDMILRRVKKDETILILGSPQRISDLAGGYLKERQRKRIKSGANCKILTDLDSSSWEDPWWKNSKREKKTLTKRSRSISPAYFVISEEFVVTIYFEEKILSLVVDHPKIVSRYKDFFEILWKSSSK
ncbi:hypothetical protein CMI41_02080 [Candidatus Pacearchaeota archaeon]|nr:hypothetical protein [Candidatus Pacearchaeota archaeon]